MTANPTIAKLEAILARIRLRSGEPRPGPHAAPAHAHDEPTEQEADHPTLPPPAVAASPVVAAAPALELAVEVDVAVEEPAPRPDTAAQAAEPSAGVAEALSSQERLVAAEAAPGAQLAEPPAGEVAHAEALAAEPSADDEIEEPPVSSRRPLAPEPEERLADMAFGAVEPRPPLHTPPPESGRLPAAPEVEFGDEDTGVHPAVSTSSAALTADVTRADLGGVEAVASIRGAVRSFQPSTFAALLEASLGL